MPRYTPHRPIFNKRILHGTIRTGSQAGAIPASVSLSTITLPVSVPTPNVDAVSINPFPSVQATGAGTSQVNLGYPSGIVDGDVVVVICRKQCGWGTLPSGFTEKAVHTNGLGNTLSVVTGSYVAATHGANFSVTYASSCTGVTRAILYSLTGVTTAVNGFSGNEVNGNDQFFPSITTPSGVSVGFSFGQGGAAMTDEQANGWTDDWGATSSTDAAWSKIITTSGAQTMVRWDNIGNVHQASFYMVPA